MEIVLALAIVYLPMFFRIARSGALAENAKTYVEAARALGFSSSMMGTGCQRFRATCS